MQSLTHSTGRVKGRYSVQVTFTVRLNGCGSASNKEAMRRLPFNVQCKQKHGTYKCAVSDGLLSCVTLRGLPQS
ncbi:hypothetical protein PsAD2_03844 [Pseudovibrio axinellae]|uniref:Uncharacterized protein n=1 Tax=Pseudovibrio axinellae TaxID=989403 RepID=A0A161XCR7_9HYPH|nr:hypothetical protein PsAD2_03844 [Pseudovibrio axinellae]SEP67921.1 hypothetical protein SAMN05421798_101136 [Pseudovibrio axinellae]